MNNEKPTENQNPATKSERINWYPGHMVRALRGVQKKIKSVDLVLEIRDARAPLASGNQTFHNLLGQKSKLVVLNKSRLAEPNNIKLWQEWFLNSEMPLVEVDAFEPTCARKIKDAANKLMQKKWLSFKKKGIKPPPMRMMIIGIPNTGKSTLINRLTKRSATRTGDRPGVTRGQEWIVLGKNLELLDTPGIMPPRIDSEQQGLWLCAIHAIRDEIVGKEKVANFVLEIVASKNPSMVQKRYHLEQIHSDIDDLIHQIGRNMNYLKKKGDIDISKTCGQILHDFRSGTLGPCSFETPPIPPDRSNSQI
jgi:ribosome biogenesis GTPase A